MALTEEQRSFVEEHAAAAMITVGRDGRPKAARVAVGFVDRRLMSSGTADRARTARIRSDPRCSVFVFESGFRWLTLETDVAIVEGPEAIDLTVRFFRKLQGRPSGPLKWFSGELGEDAFREQMVQEGRLLYEFAIRKAYGMS